MTVICPKCNAEIQETNINQTTGVAFCAACGEAFNLTAPQVQPQYQQPAAPYQQPYQPQPLQYQQVPAQPAPQAAPAKTPTAVLIAVAAAVVIALIVYVSRQSAPTAQSASAEMTFVRGGTFTMGSPASEPGRDDDEVQHSVTVSSFYMNKYEVTVGDFRQFVDATGYRTTAETSGGGWGYKSGEWGYYPDFDWKNPGFAQGEDQPVTEVSWYDAVEYCNWLSGREGLTPAYTINGGNVTWDRNANGYRLPTEAEWEYACRAGTTTPFSTGNNITTGQANYNRNVQGTYRKKTPPVGTFAPNAWGLYDMHGNVWEWCWDWYAGAVSGSNRV